MIDSVRIQRHLFQQASSKLFRGRLNRHPARRLSLFISQQCLASHACEAGILIRMAAPAASGIRASLLRHSPQAATLYPQPASFAIHQLLF
jgi:hypothetical protein